MTVTTARFEELEFFSSLEKGIDTREFILPWSTEEHREKFNDPDIRYLSIENDAGRCAGFFLLALEEGDTVEFRRVVISTAERGIGQTAILEMEAYCRENLGTRRIWLDVFAYNVRAIHIYEKLGYRKYREGELNGKPLLYYEKIL